MLDMARVRELFDASDDFTVGIEEEFAILDPDTLSLTQRFEELEEAATDDEVLGESVVGEVMSSEIEIRSGKSATFAEAIARQRDARARLLRLAGERGALLGATGTHPWRRWQDQRILRVDHYQRRSKDLGYVLWRNTTFGQHVHLGVRGADRAIAVCDRLRAVLPELLALSANSPFLDGRDTRLHSARSQIFTKSWPRCGIPEPSGSFAAYSEYVDFLARTGSIVEHSQLWWSVRPHHRFGTVEVRICDAQSAAEESDALAGLTAACIAQAALDYDDEVPYQPPPGRYVEENFWRAIRHGLDGKLVDLERAEEFPAARLAERLLAWTAPARAALGLELDLPAPNGGQRQRRALESGATMEEIYAAEVAETQRTYAAEEVRT
ncbi:MAG: YbdK family carboxylate-amine ligase [Actinomycetota bacterium]|nr:YbdK family carboxylate-amine ligase [Actinomycetota bacterium]